MVGHTELRARRDLRPRAEPSWSGYADRRRRPRWAAAAAVVVLGAGGATAWMLTRPDGSDAPADVPVDAVVDPPPVVHVPAAVAPSVPGFVSTLRGLVDGAQSLAVNGEAVPIEPGGAFSVFLVQGLTELRIVATNGAGLATEATVAVTDSPAPASYPTTVAVHVGASAWADPAVHQQVLDLARAGQINAVQLDIKDESGEVGYASTVRFATTIGAVRTHYDAPSALAELHDLGVRVIGRIVCFRDPVVGSWAWANGRADMVVQDGAGAAPLASDYGTAAFTNVGSADVRQYSIDLAVEAAALGFDEILYDYVRRPEGDLASMQLPGLEGTPEVAVARFVAATGAALAPTDTALGVSVFGISATRPTAIGQDIGLLAPLVDYVAPMVYPSHWGPGEYGVADPIHQPADIVTASLSDFQRRIAGSGAAVTPWLQDFSDAGVPYASPEVRAQIDAATAVGTHGYLLWNPGSTYHTDALPPLP